MAKTWSLIAVSLISISSVLADSWVKFKVVNSTKQKGTVKVYKQVDVSPSTVPELLDSKSIDSAGAGASVEFVFRKKIKDGVYLCVYAELDNGGRTESIYKHVEDDIEYDWTPELRLPSTKVFHKNTALEDIKNEMEYDPSLFRIKQNYSVADLFNGLFGGLVIYKQLPGNDTVSRVQIIDPVRLGTKIEPKTGQHTSKKTTILSRGAGAKVGVSIPIIAGSSIDWSSSDLYKLDIQFRNAGPILWTATQGMKSVEELFQNLPKPTLRSIGHRFNQDTTLKMAQINNAYVYEAISYVLLEFKKVNAGATLNVSTFVTSGGNYELSNEESTSDVFGSFMIGAWWDNDFSPMLNYARKVYFEEEARKLATADSVTAKKIYEEVKTDNTDLPDFINSKQAKKALEQLNARIKPEDFKIKKNGIDS